MSEPTLSSTVGELVVQRPRRSRVFQMLGIDFCCGGKLSLEEAARKQNLDPKTVLTVLLASEKAGPTEADGPDPATLGLAELCDSIERTHHAYLKTELPRLHAMIQRVVRAHGERFPWIVEVLETYEPFMSELVAHMEKEEQVLFPFIRSCESGDVAARDMSDAVRMLEHDHDDAGAALARMRQLTSDFTPPPGACNTFRATLDGLAELEHDMHQHVHKENNILFPRTLACEAPGQAVA